MNHIKDFKSFSTHCEESIANRMIRIQLKDYVHAQLKKPNYCQSVINSFGLNYSSSFCSGFLINDNSIVTNTHCIKNKKRELTCADINLVLNQNSSQVKSNELLECRSIDILDLPSDPNGPMKDLNADITIIKIESLNKKNKLIGSFPTGPITLNSYHFGYPQGGNLIKSKFTFNSIETVKNSNPFFLSTIASFIGFSTNGMSGGPLINEQCEWMGLIQFGPSKSYYYEYKSKLNNYSYNNEHFRSVEEIAPYSQNKQCLLPNIFQQSIASLVYWFD